MRTGVTKIPDKIIPRVLILAPHGRDASVAGMLLAEAHVPSQAVPCVSALFAAMDDASGCVIVTEESLAGVDLRPLTGWLAAQPAWSTLPFVVLTRRGGGLERNPIAARLSEVLENVTFIERPFHPTTLVSVVRSALRARQRQYDARAMILELHESEARLQTALKAGRLGPWEVRLPQWELSASPECKALFGYGPDEPLGWDALSSAVHDEDRQHFRDVIAHSIATGADCMVELRLQWRDASVHWAEMRARVVQDAAGRMRLVGVSSDITARKTAEQTLRELNETLEQRVEERTEQLQQANEVLKQESQQRAMAEEQLRHSQKMEIIGQLTGGVAHDFNNLLMAVMGNLDLLQKHVPPDSRLTRLIEGAMQGAQRGAALTQRLLAFARKQELKMEPRDIGTLIEGASDLLRRSAGGQINIVQDVATGLAPALVDENQFDLALLNLVVNARDAMPNGGTIRLSLEELESPMTDDLPAGRYLRMTVADEGVGMDAETLKRATEPFFSTKELGKGTGLGLSMIHGLAIQLNGALRLRSVVGEGTSAELWLPVTESRPAPEVLSVTANVPVTAGTLRILLVDDDVLIAMGSAAMLEDLGHEVFEVYSGSKALDILNAGTEIDLMITDFSMPKMNGAQLAAAARALRPGLPILLATGYAELPEGNELNLPRLAKPYMMEQLEREIASVMSGAAN